MRMATKKPYEDAFKRHMGYRRGVEGVSRGPKPSDSSVTPGQLHRKLDLRFRASPDQQDRSRTKALQDRKEYEDLFRDYRNRTRRNPFRYPPVGPYGSGTRQSV